MASDTTPAKPSGKGDRGISITVSVTGDHAAATGTGMQPLAETVASALSVALAQVGSDARVDIDATPAPAPVAAVAAPAALLGSTHRPRPTVKRQWGAERDRVMLSAIEPKPTSRAVWFGGALIVTTIALWITYLVSTIIGHFVDSGFTSLRFVLETIGYVTVMSFLTYSALMYLITRQGAFYRIRDHVRVPRAQLDTFFDHAMPTLTVLVPSYCEDPEVVRATLMTAALQEYPHMRVVLLIDDPVVPKNAADAASLAGCRALPGEIMEFLHEPRERFERALYRFEHADRRGAVATDEEVRDIAAHYEWAAAWLAGQADAYPRANHGDEFVADEILSTLARDFHRTALALRDSLADGSPIPSDRVMQLYRGLVWPFRADVTSFERKQYASLSHEANKAMNLNSYIGLMGRSFRTTPTPAGTSLVQVVGAGDLMVPDTDYVLTLDADSVLLREYCLRLVYLMEQPENERLAISQTPYSAIRGAATRLERMAGATTDIQHILHQGMTYFHATFWVGANAVIRKTALDDICEVTTVGGFEVRRYIQDNTVIEDTESSIDLLAHGWALTNYPERLSYSATPPDFGALAVQRARWANGGLLIMPKFWRYVRRQRKAGERVTWGQIAVRTNYMSSIAWASVGLVFLLVYPYDSNLLSPIILLAALPYFIAQAIDFKRLGYKRSDVFRVYGFNLILLPVNLAGVIKSLQQAAAKAKIPFARTPKVSNRTATPMIYILFAVAIIVFSFITLWRDYLLGNWGNAVFAGFNGTITTYALIAFMGIRNSIVDVALGLWMFIRVPAKPTRRERQAQQALDAQPDDWQSVLYFGASEEIDPKLAHQVYAPPKRAAQVSLVRLPDQVQSAQGPREVAATAPR